MIKTLVAHTLELDDEEAAVREILEQADPGRLLKNSLGIIACHTEFIESGIAAALCGALPFDVVGINTTAAAAPGAAEQMLLTLMVLTSDDVSFAAGLSEPLGKGREGLIGELYAGTAARLKEKPGLILVFSPVLVDLGGDALVTGLDAASGGIPLFGSLGALESVAQIRNSRVIFNGENMRDRLAIVLLSGNFEPVFSVTSLSEDRVLQQKAIITKSQGNMVMEINDMPARAYLETMKLAKGGGEITGITTAQMPLILDYRDNADPVSRSIMIQSPEGHLICGGDMPQNCSLGVGFMDAEEVLRTTAGAVGAFKERGEDGILLFSCAARNFALGLDTMAEIGVVREGLGPEKSYMFAYSGGEICPVKTREGKLKNRFHNATLVSCSFK
jgi:hypothetical protein